MIHWIIYDAREKSSGFSFYERSPGFPTQELPEILEFCRQVNSEGNGEEAVNLRYSPLGKRYLLSVIFRKPGGSEHSLRSTHRMVNFLMDSPDADAMFSCPFTQTGKWLIQKAREILVAPEHYVYVDFSTMNFSVEGVLPKTYENKIAPATLLGAASYCAASKELNNQAFIGLSTSKSEEQPLMEIAKLMSLLPVALRKRISFQTWIWSMVESKGIALNIGSAKRIQELSNTDFRGGPQTNKYAYYVGVGCEGGILDESTNAMFAGMDPFVKNTAYGSLLLTGIQSWETYLRLNELLRQKKASKAMSLLSPGVWMQLLQSKQSEKVLQAMKNDCPKGEYKKLHQEITHQLELYRREEKRREAPPAGEVVPVEMPQPVKKQNAPYATAEKRCEKPEKNTLKVRVFTALSVGIGGFLLCLWVLWSGLKKLLDLQTLVADGNLTITISLSEGIAFFRILAAFLLGVVTTMIGSWLLRELRRALRRNNKT